MRVSLSTQRRESVVSTEKEILTGDVRLVVKAGADAIPCGQSPAMHIQGRSLRRSPRIPAVGALPVEALATPVVESDITHGAVGVRDQY